jgi:hypothetical protein
LGDGTGAREFAAAVGDFPFELERVREKGTTLEARNLYWNLHPPKGWLRLVPQSLIVPPRDVDDLAAWAIALRYKQISSHKEKSRRI